MEKAAKLTDKKNAKKDQGHIVAIQPEVFESTLIDKVIC